MKKDLLIDSSGYVLNILEKILDSDIKIDGIENIPKNNPRIFVANHFTRTEAIVVPYALYELTGKKVGVIADDGLFKTYFGNFLKNIGALPKSHPNRNNIILGEILTGKKDWMIFPEGRMVKAKDIVKMDNHYCVRIDNEESRVFTGSAFFALYSELLRKDYLNKKIRNITKFKRKYLIEDEETININETMIVPINISYSPLRNGENFLKKIAKKLFDNIDEKFLEEIEIESNIVLKSKTIIRILKPISLHKMLKESYGIELNHKTTIEGLRYDLTHKFMKRIYENLTIRFEHIFALTLYHYPKEVICKNHFKRLLYLIATKVKQDCQLFEEDLQKDIINLISYEKYIPFNEILKIAIRDKIIIQTKNDYIINKENLLNKHTHNTIRLKNIIRVILNEVLIIEKMNDIVKEEIALCSKQINSKLLEILEKEEQEEFENDYLQFKNIDNIKDKRIGQPYTFTNINSNKCVIAIHGFSSAPKEVEEMALYLNYKGLNVYAPRLRGHGTVAEDLKNRNYKDWYNSVSRAITIATLKYEKVYLVGFSTGGLLALLSSKKYFLQLQGVVCINAALNLKDMRIKTILPAINFWNEIVSSFNANTLAKEYVDNHPRYPEINYDKHYVKAIMQLKELMSKTRKSLNRINANTLIIQAKDDPIVNITSAYEIYEKIHSKNKELIVLEQNEHVIIKGEESKRVFEEILNFIVKS
ncbi:alpha/beta fold hydrolase [Malaciobacter mytili]|uniref:Glycerol acyltransferase n=1 Tax=Malaciobacter mytili LMG 24559 TaxID=1032238 RepID=A0AAX2AL10_9BACT|nr:alpha/beta fold hydrolase [Malaciobacter mytili]AXH14786.1 esterase/lipase [Malaciobacter mytili LMG 24559]RXK16843.1 glycerol acyltransferase [Malaciobacter mytili LMG 24559]